jgi:hypothetical protein
LSREIVAYSLFLCSSGFFLLVSRTISVGIVSTLMGLAALVSIDMVYATVERRSRPVEKSASVVATGILLFAVLAHVSPLLIAILAGKCFFYVMELLKSRRRSLVRLLASGVRMAAGFVLPLLLLGPEQNVWFVVMFVLIGESINRAEFYLDLDIVTPSRQIERDTLRELTLHAMER